MCPSNENQTNEDSLTTACRLGLLHELTESYLSHCRMSGVSLPNLAGFCRFCGFDGHAPERLRREFPEHFSSLCLIFEDEALNSKVSASVLSAYLKRRLSYGGEEADSAPCEVGQLKLIFEHDILSDGE